MHQYSKQWLFVAAFAVSTLVLVGCNSKKADNEQASATDKSVQVSATDINANELSILYFHATRRCTTCEAVEKVTKEALTEFYGDSIPFHSINRDEQKELAKEYEIEWQTLLAVKGDKKINLTNEAFLNARTNPDKLKGQIKSAIDSLQ